MSKQDMTNNNQQSQAKEALDTVQQMKRAAYLKAMPPVWFGVTIALLSGLLVTLSALDLRQYHALVILLLGIVISYQVQKVGVAIKKFPAKHIVYALIILLPLFFGLIIIAQLLRSSLGYNEAAILAGALFAAIVYGLSIVERRWYDSKTDSEQN